MCIHLKASNPLDIDQEKDLKPILSTQLQKDTQNGSLLMKYISDDLKVSPQQIKGFDLCFADSQKPSIFGLKDDFISSARIDNIYSLFCSIKAIIESDVNEDVANIIFGFDHEEIGSQTYVGADSSYMRVVLEGILQGLKVDHIDQVI